MGDQGQQSLVGCRQEHWEGGERWRDVDEVLDALDKEIKIKI